MLDACGVTSPKSCSPPAEAVRLNRRSICAGISEYEIVQYFRDRAAECAMGYASFSAPACTIISVRCWWIPWSRAASSSPLTRLSAEIAQGTLTPSSNSRP